MFVNDAENQAPTSNRIALLETETGAMRWQRDVPYAWGAAWSFDNQYVSYVDSTSLQFVLLNAANGSELTRAAVRSGGYGNVAWSNDRSWVAVRRAQGDTAVHVVLNGTLGAPTIVPNGGRSVWWNNILFVRTGTTLTAYFFTEPSTGNLSFFSADVATDLSGASFDSIPLVSKLGYLLVLDTLSSVGSPSRAKLYRVPSLTPLELPALAAGDVLRGFYVADEDFGDDTAAIFVRVFQRGTTYFAQQIDRSLQVVSEVALNPNAEFAEYKAGSFGGYQFAFLTERGRLGAVRGFTSPTPEVIFTDLPCTFSFNTNYTQLAWHVTRLYVTTSGANFGATALPQDAAACVKGSAAYTGQITRWNNSGGIEWAAYPRDPSAVDTTHRANVYASQAQPGGSLVASAGTTAPSSSGTAPAASSSAPSPPTPRVCTRSRGTPTARGSPRQARTARSSCGMSHRAFRSSNTP
ncbi:MAG: hypothetical protein HC933_02120 [Pleurocapsa sp. SU_196_0]|nr:hypothetical protein [Pleurocapsa sp. SU_196_0]